MKIALIAERIGQQPDSGPYPGDAANRVIALASAVAELDHQVTVYARNDSPAIPGPVATIAGVSIELIDAGPPERLTADKVLPHIGAFAAELARCWRQSPPDVAHASDWLAGLAALSGARHLGIPVVQTFRSLASASGHGHVPQTRDLTDQARLEAGIGRSAAAVLAGTSQDLAALVRRGLPQTAIKIVPDCVDTTRFGPSGPVARSAGRPRILMFAPLGDQQVSIALHALARVPDAELVVAGGPDRAELPGVPGYTEVTGLASQLQVQDRLILAGRISGAKAPALMRSADVLISLSTREPFSMTAVEAMACGVPVLATAAGAQRDAVIHGTTGFLVPSAEPDVLARRIRQLLCAPMLREGLGIAATARARARYSRERIAQETLSVYSALQLSATRAA